MKYEKLFEFKFLHDYFNDGGIGLFEITPSPNTEKVLKNYKLIFKSSDRGFYIGFQSLGSGKLRIQLDKNIKFKFFVYSKDKYILNYTDLAYPVGQQILCLDNSLKPQFFGEFPMFTQDEQNIIKSTLPFAIVEISADTALPDAEKIINQVNEMQVSLAPIFEAKLRAREIYWRYTIKSYETAQFEIIGEGFFGSFDQSVVAKDQTVFVSKSALACRDVPITGITLQLADTKKIKISNLPNPDVSSIAQDKDGKFYGNVFVNI